MDTDQRLLGACIVEIQRRRGKVQNRAHREYGTDVVFRGIRTRWVRAGWDRDQVQGRRPEPGVHPVHDGVVTGCDTRRQPRAVVRVELVAVRRRGANERLQLVAGLVDVVRAVEGLGEVVLAVDVFLFQVGQKQRTRAVGNRSA